MDSIPLLMEFGMTQQEAKLYVALYDCGQTTGYELAKQTGISRSNAYAGLASLVEKGGAYLIEGRPARYEAVPSPEFCRNIIHRLQSAADELERLLPTAPEQETAYLTIRGERNIRDKISTMLGKVQYRVYLSMAGSLLEPFRAALEELVREQKKVVLVTDKDVEFPGAAVHRMRVKPDGIRVIADSRVALTGTLDQSPSCTCLYSMKENLVSLLKDSVRNEIRLIELEKEKEKPEPSGTERNG